jgi:hypothetical protein
MQAGEEAIEQIYHLRSDVVHDNDHLDMHKFFHVKYRHLDDTLSLECLLIEKKIC